MTEKQWICYRCKKEFDPEYKWEQKEDWVCVECAYRVDIIRWEQMICPIMNHYTTKKKMVHCQTVNCPSFQRSHRTAYCKIIDRDYNYPELSVTCQHNV